MTVFDEIIRSDNAELLEIVYPNYKQQYQPSLDKHVKIVHIASGMGSMKCLEFLLNKGENPNQICSNEIKSTPLHFAVHDDNTNAV